MHSQFHWLLKATTLPPSIDAAATHYYQHFITYSDRQSKGEPACRGITNRNICKLRHCDIALNTILIGGHTLNCRRANYCHRLKIHTLNKCRKCCPHLSLQIGESISHCCLWIIENLISVHQLPYPVWTDSRGLLAMSTVKSLILL